ncbi:MAG: hypothetical protein RBG13Loki_1284 [Promethearchaeota archaeon CR_4]|nr:MAG: hypothetical protein RBG13Loki_1284 [Candidatus Lokiarchaeota archaeon CR_4]
MGFSRNPYCLHVQQQSPGNAQDDHHKMPPIEGVPGNPFQPYGKNRK